MATFLNRLRSSSADPAAKKKDEPPADLTPLERLLYRAGPQRIDGTDKFYGLENFGNTCYCNSILQPLFFCDPFRHAVLSHSTPFSIAASAPPKVRIRVAPNLNRGSATAPANQKMSNGEAARWKHGIAAGQSGVVAPRPEDRPEAPEYKKKQAMIKGPILELAYQDAAKPGPGDTTLAALQDIFRTLIEAENRTGVLSPQRFLEIFKSNNESFRNSQHQDAHEFLGLVLNSLISTVDAHSKELRMQTAPPTGGGQQHDGGQDASADLALSLGHMMDGAHLPMASSSGWVHDIFEGVLTSETRCLTCETASKRNETFLDLSIDLEEHTSVTSCLKNFSAEEMLCERNKFHCDNCGSLQEAEKRMKVKRLPRVLALHLKRFKFTDDYTALNKLFHRVVYPPQLRLFNTTDDAGDADRAYELYAVVIHIGPQAAQGHYVAVIKTKEWGWLLFDDEMVEPVDKDFVNNFFGGRPGQPCAYVLFYQEIDPDALSGTHDASEHEGVAKPVNAKLPAAATENGSAITNGILNGNHAPKTNGFKEKADSRNGTAAISGDAPATPAKSTTTAQKRATAATPSNTFANMAWKVWKEHRAEATAVAAAEKLAKRVAEKRGKGKAAGASAGAHGGGHDAASRCRDQNPLPDAEDTTNNRKISGSGGEGADLPVSSGFAGAGLLGRSHHRAYKPQGRRGFGFLTSKNGKSAEFQPATETPAPSDPPAGDQRTEHHEGDKERLKDRFGFNLGRKKSTNMLSSSG